MKKKWENTLNGFRLYYEELPLFGRGKKEASPPVDKSILGDDFVPRYRNRWYHRLGRLGLRGYLWIIGLLHKLGKLKKRG